MEPYSSDDEEGEELLREQWREEVEAARGPVVAGPGGGGAVPPAVVAAVNAPAPAPENPEGAAAAAAAQRALAQLLLDDLGEETPGARRLVYLVTISRVLAATLAATNFRDVKSLSREQVADFVRDAFDNPVAMATGGRPVHREGGVVDKLAVFKEPHNDGDEHFHVAVRLFLQRAFLPAKETLRARHRLPSHWSSTHTLWWSALRYPFIPTPKKPEVDSHPFVWTADGRELDLFAEAQEPYQAHLWKARREKDDKRKAAAGKPQKFTKPDLTSLVISQALHSKAAVIAYAKSRGTAAMQAFVDKNIRKLPEFIADAEEWAHAEQAVRQEAMTDWAVLCRAAEGNCEFGGEACSYRRCAAEVFNAQAGYFAKRELAVALRAILLTGPSKTVRAPMLVGPTNSGKTTLVKPFDRLFGHSAVFHKPARGSTFALRNITAGKRYAQDF